MGEHPEIDCRMHEDRDHVCFGFCLSSSPDHWDWHKKVVNMFWLFCREVGGK